MLRLLNISFNGDIHCFFITNIKVGNRIHHFRKHKGHYLAYDGKIMTSQQRLSRIVTSTFL